MERTKKEPLSKQMKQQVKKQPEAKAELEGSTKVMISTGSTLLDLAISGGRVRGGGIPGGILVEIFGPNGTGKTVLLSEIAGDVHRKGGDIMFHDPEARLDKQFAGMFGFEVHPENYLISNTVSEVFAPIRKWEPKVGKADAIHGIFADSLAALSTGLEMENEEGDKMGMRRAKEFSEELRKTCRIIQDKNFLMACSNQVRENIGATGGMQKYSTPGGLAVGYYASLRLRTSLVKKMTVEKTIAGKETSRVIGIIINVEVFKSSVWKPYRTAPITIILDYGVDDVRSNLQFIKDFTKNTTYTIGGESLGKSMDDSIKIIEDDGLEKQLREEVIDLWEEIESKFTQERKPKQR